MRKLSLTVATLAGDVPLTLDSDASISGAQLHASVAAALGLPPVRAARLRLARGPTRVPDDSTASGVADGDMITAVVAPAEPPPQKIDESGVRSRRAARTRAAHDDASDDDEDAVFRYRPPVNKLARALCDAALRAGAPEAAVGVASRLPRALYLTLFLWPLGAKLASEFGLGPVYIILTIIAAIFANLGTRRPGEASAYTVFNDAFRPLLGQFTADAVDAHVRRGGM